MFSLLLVFTSILLPFILVATRLATRLASSCLTGEQEEAVITCMCRRQVELSPGVPWSAAVTMKVYSERSPQLRGKAVFSSPVTGLRVKRSALAPTIR